MTGPHTPTPPSGPRPTSSPAPRSGERSPRCALAAPAPGTPPKRGGGGGRPDSTGVGAPQTTITYDEARNVGEQVGLFDEPETIKVNARELRTGDVAVAGSFGLHPTKPIRITAGAAGPVDTVHGHPRYEFSKQVGNGPITTGVIFGDSVITLLSRDRSPAADHGSRP